MNDLLKAADAMAEALRPRLSAKMRKKIEDNIEAEWAVGSSRMAETLRFVLDQEDKRAVALAAYEAAKREERVRHVKRGTSYTVASRTGRLQTSRPLHDMDIVVTYIGSDGEWWHRPPDEFDDGRFVKESLP